jgi:hypothetical protein
MCPRNICRIAVVEDNYSRSRRSVKVKKSEGHSLGTKGVVKSR